MLQIGISCYKRSSGKPKMMHGDKKVPFLRHRVARGAGFPAPGIAPPYDGCSGTDIA
jgi:hypothetical protein